MSIVQCTHCLKVSTVSDGENSTSNESAPIGWLKDDLGLFCCQQCMDDEHSLYGKEENSCMKCGYRGNDAKIEPEKDFFDRCGENPEDGSGPCRVCPVCGTDEYSGFGLAETDPNYAYEA